MIRLSDARMSGTSYGACILHVAPEAFIGGPLALIKNGDIIEVDIPNRKLNVDISEDEMKKRKDEWEIGAAFAANIASHHFGNKFIHHFCHTLHAAWNHIGSAHRADQKNGTDANGKQHKQAGVGE